VSNDDVCGVMEASFERSIPPQRVDGTSIHVHSQTIKPCACLYLASCPNGSAVNLHRERFVQRDPFAITHVPLDVSIVGVTHMVSGMSEQAAPNVLTEPNQPADSMAPGTSDPSSLPTEQTPPAVPKPLPEGKALIGRTLLERYVLLDELGAGGMGVVYRARDEITGEEIALKMLPARWAGKAEAVERFKREATVIASIQHPAVCPVIAFHDEESVPFFTMKLVHGPTLRELVESDPSPSPAERYGLLLQIAKGLEAVHASGVVHRDLKPENVLVQSGQAVLIDFGLAKRFFTEGVTTTKVIGTPKYMAPEQLQGGPVGSWTDVYSFGVMAFELLSDKARALSKSDDGFDTTAPFKSVELTTDVVRALQSFFSRALALSWKDRFGSATEMRAAFECAWAGLAIDRPSSKVPPLVGNSVAPAANAPPWKGWWTWAVFGCTLILVLAGVGSVLAQKNEYMPILMRSTKDWVACDALKPTVEVAAFKNSSGEAQWDSFASSVAPSFRSHLRTSPKLKVPHENPEFGHCPTAWVVDGSVQKIGGKLRLAVEVHDATRVALVPPIELDDTAGNTANILGKARDILLDDLRRQARFKERDRRAYFGTKNEEARKSLFDYYRLVGTNLQPRKEDLEVGKTLLDAALALDPDYVSALVERAYLLSLGVGGISAPTGVRKGLVDLDRALMLQRGNPDVLVMRCRLLRHNVEAERRPTDNAIDKALAYCGDALTADPTSAYVRLTYARLYGRLCDEDRAMESLEQVLLLDRSLSDIVLQDLVNAAMHNGRLQIADRRSQELVDSEEHRKDGLPSGRGAHLLRGAVLLRLAELDPTRYSDARREFEIEIDRANANVGQKWVEAGAIRGLMHVAKFDKTAVSTGLRNRLLELEQEALAIVKFDPLVARQIAYSYQYTAPEAALEWLERAGRATGFEQSGERAFLLQEARRYNDARGLLKTLTPLQQWERQCYDWLVRRTGH